MNGFIRNTLAPALQVQLSLVFGFGVSLLVSFFYLALNDARFPQEKPQVILVGLFLSLACWFIGYLLAKDNKAKKNLNLSEGAWVVLFTWMISCSISAIVFMLAGFPIPGQEGDFTLFRRFVDGFYESMSGFTTTGTSVLPNIEAFSQSVLFWRALTHWIGGMGIAFFAVTIWKKFTARRAEVINGEAESPHIMNFKSEEDAILSGKDFLKAYGVLSIICFVLLLISGYYFRIIPYEKWYDNVYDALATAFSTMGTGGFMHYNASVGLPIAEYATADGVAVIGGLRNVVSEWIVAFFMLFAGMNFGLWYIAFFQAKKWRNIFSNYELRSYLIFVLVCTFGIWVLLELSPIMHTIPMLDNLRHAFFGVTTIISTTGSINDDFAKWPVAAQGILFACYLVGGCVGSTGGGLKFTRFLIAIRYGFMQIKNLISGRHDSTFMIDGVKYNEKSSGLVLTTIIIYFGLFLFGSIVILATSSKAIFTDGTVRDLDFVSGFTASIANLGNIGPAIVNGTVGDGPTGNYSAFSDFAKVFMIFLMYLGRVGVLSILLFFVTNRGEKELVNSTTTVNFDSDTPILLGR